MSPTLHPALELQTVKAKPVACTAKELSALETWAQQEGEEQAGAEEQAAGGASSVEEEAAPEGTKVGCCRCRQDRLNAGGRRQGCLLDARLSVQGHHTQVLGRYRGE